MAYVSDVLADPYGALVFGRDDQWAGVYWVDGRPVEIERVRVHGDGLRWAGERNADGSLGERDTRQVNAFGDDGIALLRRASVSVVGAGGIGAHICQQLAYLGVGQLSIIDFDRVDGSNLNRLVGAGPDDVGRLKVEVAEREVRRINLNVGVEAIAESALHADSLRALREADVVIGAVDNAGARLVMNELAIAFAKPYVDCGTGIEASQGEVSEAGGQVFTYLPGRPCLLCAGMIDLRRARVDLSPEEQQAEAITRGYVSGADVDAPAVVFINGTIASVGVGEVVALVKGLRRTKVYSLYNYMSGTLSEWKTERMSGCPACAWASIGEKVKIERYAALASA